MDFPPVAWSTMRGVFTSMDYVHSAISSGSISFMMEGMIRSQNNKRLYNETIIDYIRSKYYPNQVSRLSGMYFFKTREEAISRINDKNWPEYFIENNLLELDFYTFSKPTIVDSNWITYADLNSQGLIDLENLDWIHNYWSGKEYSSEPVWELISDGFAIVLNEDKRRNCERLLKELFPESHIQILISRLSSEAGGLGGLAFPFLLRVDDEYVKLTWLGYDKDFHDKDLIKKMMNHPDAPVLEKMMRENETCRDIDFSKYNKLIKIQQYLIIENDVIPIVSVHSNESN